MRASSLAAYEQGEKLLNDAIAKGEGVSQKVVDDFFSLADLAREYPKLVVVLSDPARTLTDKQKVLEELGINAKLDSLVLDINNALIDTRWSQPYDLIEAWEQLAIQAMVSRIAKENKLNEVSEQLFAVTEFLLEYRDVRVNLTDRKGRRQEERLKLARDLFSSQLGEYAQLLVERAVITISDVRFGSGEHRSISSRLRYYQSLIAMQIPAQIVTVQVAVPLEESQEQRLVDVLQRKFGKQIILNISVDPQLMGGIRLQIGEKTYDGSILSQVNETKQKMAG